MRGVMRQVGRKRANLDIDDPVQSSYGEPMKPDKASVEEQAARPPHRERAQLALRLTPMRLLPEEEEELRDAARFYEAEQQRLGRALIQEVRPKVVA